MLRLILALAITLLPAVAHAEWREAVSNNFIVVSEESESELRERIENLEKFGLIVQAMTGAKRLKDNPVKIKMYIVPTVTDVQKSMDFPDYRGGVAGYYSASTRGPFAVMPRYEIEKRNDVSLKAITIIQHELTHHFMYQYFPGAYPSWYGEGFADYMGLVAINGDKAITGLPNNDRIGYLRRTWVPLDKLLVARSYADMGNDVFAIYAEGWLLVHYLNTTPEGKKKLGAYLRAIGSGTSYEEALKELGDIDKLDSELRKYSLNRRFDATETQWKNLDPGPIKIRTLPPVEAAFVDTDMRINSGIAKADIEKYATDTRAKAAEFPNDPYALRILTEIERLAGNPAQAKAAAQRWAVAAPDDGLAQMHLGELEIEALKKAGSTDKGAWDDARQKIVEASKLTPNNPQIFKAYYESYKSQGVMPPAGAQNALMTALDLVPQDDDLRYEVARDFEQRGYYKDAIFVIMPLAVSIREEKEKSPKEKAKEARMKEKFAVAGREDDNEDTPHKMLKRLQEKLAEKEGGHKPASETKAKPADAK